MDDSSKAAAYWDVWFVHADQVYQSVPWEVVLGWVEQGRLGEQDQLRPSRSQEPWAKVRDLDRLQPFRFRAPAAEDSNDGSDIDLDTSKPRREADDDEVDMIPLIDISLVLLVFFMMTAVVSVSSPISVPEMKYAEELAKESDSITVQIDKRSDGSAFYALRLGNRGPTTDDHNLSGLRELFTRLDTHLSERKEPPEVRIACHQELPSALVREVTKELDRRRRDGKIRVYSADVNEASK